MSPLLWDVTNLLVVASMDGEAHDGTVITTRKIKSGTTLDVDDLVNSRLGRHLELVGWV